MRTLKRSECAILPLVLKGEWYDMIASGEKREEYREAKPYWIKRIRNNWLEQTKVQVVEFRRGYAKNAPRMSFKMADTFYRCIAHTHTWGEPNGVPHYAIALGERVELEGGAR